MRKEKNLSSLSIISMLLLLCMVILLGVLFFYVKALLFSENEGTANPAGAEGELTVTGVKAEEADNGPEPEAWFNGIQETLISQYVFVGDSRYVGMSDYAEDNDIFICENNMGYRFLLENLDYINEICDEKTALIIGLGVNDVNYNSENYIRTLNEMVSYIDGQIYYMLVNPVDEEREMMFGYGILNEKIDEFNKKMIEGLDEEIYIIDTSSYLKMQGYVTVDGLHYTEETYGMIYDYIKSEIADTQI